jgi:hypothetical protein
MNRRQFITLLGGTAAWPLAAGAQPVGKRYLVGILSAGGGDVQAALAFVMTAAGDPLGSGLVVSLARPGGNVTSMSLMAPDLGAKRVGYPVKHP